MRVTSVTCDRCGILIDARVAVLDLLGGTLPRQRDRVNLCERCAGLFADWLASGRPDQPPTTARRGS
jgi:hypothetical protein